MANAVVYIELEEGIATRDSLVALNRGRAVATRLGATLYAVVPCAALPTYEQDDIVAVLSRHGADKVALITNPQLASPPLFATHENALRTTCDELSPQLVLLPAGCGGRDIGPRLALQLDGYFVGDASLSDGPVPRVAHHAFRGRYRAEAPLVDAPRPLVIALAPDPLTPGVLTNDEAEVVVLQAASLERAALRVLEAARREGTVMLGGGAGLSKQGFELLRQLAERLGAQAIATSTACARGLAPAELGIDGAAAVDAEIYVAFGVSGSEEHLMSIAPHTVVVAVNADPGAPIFDIASYGVVADADDTLRSWLAACTNDVPVASAQPPVPGQA